VRRYFEEVRSYFEEVRSYFEEVRSYFEEGICNGIVSEVADAHLKRLGGA
jgi:hypothetical protein